MEFVACGYEHFYTCSASSQLTINMLMLCALAPIMFPRSPRTDEQMKNHLRPNMSESRPTSVKPIAKPAVQEMLTQMISGDGPIAALIKLKVFDGSTHPRYLK